MLVHLLFSFLALCAVPVLGFFKLPCDNPLIQERADPIIAPGKVAGHTHTVNGGSNFALDATYETLRKSECSSCRAKADLSAYWSPQLYIEWANGSFSDVPHLGGGGGLIYYLPRSHSKDKTKVLAFPEGFKMLAGDPFRRTYNDKAEVDRAIGWNCLGSPSPTRNPWLPRVNCPDGLRGEIRFPSCWDGKNLYKSDQSHVAYSKGESGPCPSTHPKRVVTIFFEVFYDVDRFKNDWSKAKDPKSPFVLAQGDPTGYGYHGDFLNGWDVPILQKAIDTCDSPTSGNIEECKVLELFDRKKDGYVYSQTPDVNEAVLGNLQKLPGCNPITNTEKAAKEASSTCPNLKTPSLFSKPAVYDGTVAPPGAQVVKGTPRVAISYKEYKYLGCYEDKGPRLLSKTLNPKLKSVKACLDLARSKGYVYAGLEYGGECYVSNVKPAQSKRIGYDKCSMTCVDDGSTICGGPSALTAYRLVRPVSNRHKRQDSGHLHIVRLALAAFKSP
ncbi:DUF1996 and WSC domain-containing protein [Sporobolomyces koalae]|uniref:DUF1996 and WSC domain-containing protein n=1 Tax=Sporobolomyces koalae TaxID=500713 RepID=UPI0031700AD0